MAISLSISSGYLDNVIPKPLMSPTFVILYGDSDFIDWFLVTQILLIGLYIGLYYVLGMCKLRWSQGRTYLPHPVCALYIPSYPSQKESFALSICSAECSY